MAPIPQQVILGIDPGTVVMGFAVVNCQGRQVSLVEMGVLKMSSSHDVFERLHLIHQRIDEVIRKHQPKSLAIEAPFFGKNVQSMLKLGRAQGVAIACALQHGLSVTEYSPSRIKQAITGNGNASKEQVWAMLQRALQLKEKPKQYDASDALAVAVSHHFQLQSPVSQLSKSKAKGWEDFIKKNPGRLKS
jgi:crossover junction endodeoxyribonuclease RuvC